MPETVTGSVSVSVSVSIACPPTEVFAAVRDVTRMGEWSPEATSARWIEGEGAALGAMFEGDNVAKAGPITLKKWTTVCEVTGFEPGAVFEFVAANTTTWRYEVEAADGGSRVIESFSYPQYTGFQRIFYSLGGSRRKALVRGMEQTLAGLKAMLEG